MGKRERQIWSPNSSFLSRLYMWLACVELSLIVGFSVFPGVYKYEQAHHTINHLYQPALSVAVLISACAKTSGAQRQRRNAAHEDDRLVRNRFDYWLWMFFQNKSTFFFFHKKGNKTTSQNAPWDVSKNELRTIKPFILMILESIRSSAPVICDRSSSSTRLKQIQRKN